jgi:hypothetical protein
MRRELELAWLLRAWSFPEIKESLDRRLAYSFLLSFPVMRNLKRPQITLAELEVVTLRRDSCSISHFSFLIRLLLVRVRSCNFVDRSVLSPRKRSTKSHEAPRNKIQKMAK